MAKNTGIATVISRTPATWPCLRIRRIIITIITIRICTRRLIHRSNRPRTTCTLSQSWSHHPLLPHSLRMFRGWFAPDAVYGYPTGFTCRRWTGGGTRPVFNAPTAVKDSMAKSPASAETETFTARRITIGESMQTFVTVINPRLVARRGTLRKRSRSIWQSFLIRDCNRQTVDIYANSYFCE